jgi:signal transduction histidine kinase
MRSLTLRIYVTVVAALALFALGSGWLVQRHFEEQRGRVEAAVRERGEAWGDLIQRALPPADAPAAEQAAALRDWSLRLRVPMALDDAKGQRIGASDAYIRRDLDNPALGGRVQTIVFDDGRVLRVPRPGAVRGMPGARPGGPGGPGGPGMAGMPPGGDPRLMPALLRPPWLPEGVGLVLLLLIIFLAVAAGSWPVVRRLTRRLDALKQGVEAFGAGNLNQRVSEEGRDEVAALGTSFNRAATRIEALLRSHQSLLANASHELRSPLARLTMAVQMLEDSSDSQRARLKREIDTNIAELDALVEEVLLASRLDGTAHTLARDPVNLLAVAAEEAARLGAAAQGDDAQVPGDEKLLRRAVRNLLENARRYGGTEIDVRVINTPAGAEVRVSDRGPGVPEAYRERIFEAFFRLPGHAEREGGVGLGLALVRQIANAHGGSARCEPREGGGSCFVLVLPR